MNTSELEHFGIKGMRWGVRRKSGKSSGDAATADRLSSKLKTGGSKSLTNKELKKVIERMRLEKQFKELAPDTPQKKVGKFVGDMLLTAGKAEVSKIVLGQAAKQAAKIFANLR